jgi:hypothetical protein
MKILYQRIGFKQQQQQCAEIEREKKKGERKYNKK